jgi:hypothetical protein
MHWFLDCKRFRVGITQDRVSILSHCFLGAALKKRNLIAVLLVSLFSKQIIAAAVYHKSYVGCYYYDQKNPYASILRKKSWVWARTPSKEYLSVSGHYSGGFFVVNKSDISKEEMLLACQRSIPASKKVLKMVALNHFYQSQEFVFSFVNELKVVVIGASLSDPGNLQRKIKLMPRKPYWNGRFADGPIWTDYLSRHFDVAIDNWSYGGSKTSLKINHQKTFFPRLQVWIQNNLITGNMLDTIHSYFRTRKPDHKMLKDTLFILVGGANNYLHKAVMLKQEYPSLRKNKPRLRGEVTQAVGQTMGDLRRMVDLLYKKGAKNILVLSLSDMPKTPYAKIHHLEVALRLLSVKHNKQLRNFLRKKSTVIK